VLTPSENGLKPFVDRLILRSALTEPEREALCALPYQAMCVAARHPVTRPGEISHHASFVAAGLVGRVGQTASGQRQLTAIHLGGDMADLLSVVRPGGVGALLALTEATIFRVPHRALRRIAAEYPAIAEAFWRHCAVDTATLMQWLLNIGRGDAVGRLAHLICELATRVGGEREQRLQFHLPLTQEHLADATGMTPVHVNRSLRRLRELKLMTIHRHYVDIHDWEALASRSGFDADYLAFDTDEEPKVRLLTA
jgi:CRP-like cAMP-binding protein